MKVCFIILHYNNESDTVNCINSIINTFNEESFDILVVDNGSINHSGENIKNIFMKNTNIEIVFNKKNVGFSKGNNVGFKIAKDRNYDFIIMINNDTLIKQKEFLNLIKKEYDKSHFAVLGPKIILKDGTITPVRTEFPTQDDIKRLIKYNKKMIVLTKLNLNSLYIKLKKIFKKEKNNSYDERIVNPILHGCCWIFSKQYIEKEDGLLEKTFLYCEEEFLAIQLKRKNLISIYNPNIEIYHMEFASTLNVEKTIKKSTIRRYKNLIIAEKVLLDEMMK